MKGRLVAKGPLACARVCAVLWRAAEAAAQVGRGAAAMPRTMWSPVAAGPAWCIHVNSILKVRVVRMRGR